MADYTVSIDLPDHKRGDLWPGIPLIGPVVINEATPALSLSRIRMTLRKGGSVFIIDSESNATRNAPAVITDATHWQAEIPEIGDFVQAAGDWKWDMEFWESGKTAPITCYQGTLTVHADV